MPGQSPPLSNNRCQGASYLHYQRDSMFTPGNLALVTITQSYLSLLQTNITINTLSQKSLASLCWWLKMRLFNNWLMQLSWCREVQIDISDLNQKHLCYWRWHWQWQDTTVHSVYCVTVQCSVVIKFLNEVSQVSPYFKVHWTKCTVLKRSQGIPPVILARLVGQKAICQNILNWCKAITSSPPQPASPADRNGNILINSPQVETLDFVAAWSWWPSATSHYITTS